MHFIEVKQEKFVVEGFEKVEAAFKEYAAEQKERFKNFSDNGEKSVIANDISREAQTVATSAFSALLLVRFESRTVCVVFLLPIQPQQRILQPLLTILK